MKKGDIVLIPFPFTNLVGKKNRPALVLIQSELDITVSFITTQLSWDEKSCVKITPSSTNGLKKTSLIRLDKITTVSKDLILGTLGELTNEELRRVDQRLIELLQLM